MEQSATPPDAAPAPVPEQGQPSAKSLDDKILAKFGLSETDDTETDPEATPAEGEETDGAEGEPAIEEEQPLDPDQPVGDFELTHNGEQKRVPMAEAKRLAQMGYDYEFKMQRLNGDVAQVKAMLAANQARAAAQLQAIDALADVRAIERQLAPYTNVDWIAASNADPQAAFQMRVQHDALVQAWQQAHAKAEQAAQPIAQASQRLNEAQLALEAQKLTDRIPEWKDAARRKADTEAILNAMVKDYGFAGQEIGGPLLQDHRVVAILRDAWKYRAAMSSQKARKGPPPGTPKVATPGAKPQPRSNAQAMGDLKRGLHQVQSREGRKALEDALVAKKFGLK